MSKVEELAIKLHKDLVKYYTGTENYLDYPSGHALLLIALFEAQKIMCEEIKGEV
jgi:hypothetical protein